MKTIHVVAAIIERDGHVLATQRGYGEFEGGWEFPGGKVEPGETEEQALIREIHEELNAEIVINRHLCTVDYDYETFHLHMGCYLCTLAENHIDLLEHAQARWLDRETIDSVARVASRRYLCSRCPQGRSALAFQVAANRQADSSRTRICPP